MTVMLAGASGVTFTPEIVREAGLQHTGAVHTAGLSVGAGFGTTGMGGNLRHDFLNGQLQMGRTLGGMAGEDEWWQGRWMILGELSGGHRYGPDAASVASATPVVRYQFLPDSTVAPFIEAGLGATWTDIGEPDLSTRFQFNSHGGGGLHWFFQEETAFTVGYRLIHYSNGGMRSPNSGVNVHAVMLGLTYFY